MRSCATKGGHGENFVGGHMKAYIHQVQYYETDRMGIVHHSNYVRWMEEARMDFFRQIGCGYEKLEAEGIISPVTSVECKYRKTTTFAEEIHITVQVAEFKGVKLKLKYIMMRGAEVVSEGISEHCFLDDCGRIVSLKKASPVVYEILAGQVKEG